MSPGEDKRKSVRIPVQLTVRYEIGDQQYSGTALNLSADGIFLKSADILRQDDRIEILLDLSDTRSLKIPSRVIWAQWIEGVGTPTAGMGVQFEYAQPGDRDLINSFIHHLMGN
jgi:Tfp pilus assembly protein PilZ